MPTSKNNNISSDYKVVESSTTESNSESESTALDLEKGNHASTGTNRTAFSSSVWRTDTEVEQIAERIEQRRANRVHVTFHARVRFLKECRQIAQDNDSIEARISLNDLKAYRDRVVYDELEAGKGIINSHFFHNTLGIKSDVQCLAKILEQAVELLESKEIDTGDWLYYKDFSFDYTRVVSRWPLMRHPLGVASAIVLLYYLFTPLLFCVIMPSSNICDTSVGGYKGWVDALYFASTTISTVGYGDLTVDQDPKYASFVGSMYMLLSMVVAVAAFSAIASSAINPLEKPFEQLFKRFSPKKEKDLFLHERIAKVKFIKIFELAVEIVAFIMIGVFASQIAVYFDNDPKEGTDWSWMTSFYWAIQTTTTIGYGDLAQPESLRYFKIFYLMISTVLVGNALGKLGGLQAELSDVRREHAWDRRPVTKRMIDEMQAYDHDDKVDQYEFLVSSLVSLGKLSSEEIRPIMDKFREHAGNKGYIAVDDVDEVDILLTDEQAESQLESDVIDTEL